MSPADMKLEGMRVADMDAEDMTAGGTWTGSSQRCQQWRQTSHIRDAEAADEAAHTGGLGGDLAGWCPIAAEDAGPAGSCCPAGERSSGEADTVPAGWDHIAPGDWGRWDRWGQEDCRTFV